MKCSVFRSSLKDYTYIYLRDGHKFEDLPIALIKNGYHLQMPPQEDATGLLELPEKKKTLF